MPSASGPIANEAMVALLLVLVVTTSSWALLAPQRFASYARRSVDAFAGDSYTILERRRQVWQYYRVFGALMLVTAVWIGYAYFIAAR